MSNEPKFDWSGINVDRLEAEGADALVERSISPKARTVSMNTDQDVIVTTRDKVELALRRNLDRYLPAGQVLSSVGLFVALLTAMLTAQFQALVLSGEAWRGVFLLATIAAGALAFRDTVRLLRKPKLSELVESIARDAS